MLSLLLMMVFLISNESNVLTEKLYPFSGADLRGGRRGCTHPPPPKDDWRHSYATGV